MTSRTYTIDPGDPHNDQLAARANDDLDGYLSDIVDPLLDQGDEQNAPAAAILAGLAMSLMDQTDTMPRDRLATLLALACLRLVEDRRHQATVVDVQHGLFGQGIFGTGIDLSALDENTAWRLGLFYGEQLNAAELRGRQWAVDKLNRLAEIHGHGLAYRSALAAAKHLESRMQAEPLPASGPTSEEKGADGPE